MDDNTRKKVAAFLLGVASGALLGAALAILYAPQTGEETRDMIRRTRRQWGERARNEGDEFVQRVNEATDEWAARLQALADDMVKKGPA